MSIMSWNCQGLRNPWTIRHLKEMRKEYFPDMLVLMEIKNLDAYVTKVQGWLGYRFLKTVEPLGCSGGLALFWKDNLHVDFLFVDKNLIDMKVSSASHSWFVTCVYGNPVTSLRSIVWDKLTTFGLTRSEAWCMIGDFNAILSNEEKLGGPVRDLISFHSFQSMLADCDMSEISSSGDGFTWGGVRNKQWIQCKLDRSFANPAWLTMFPKVHQWFLEKLGSDHKPVLVKFFNDKKFFTRQFWFDKRWAEDPSFLEVFQRAWNKDSVLDASSFVSRSENCKLAIQLWKKRVKSNSAIRIQKLRKELAKQDESLHLCFNRISQIKRELALVFREKEIFWRQKSKEKWMLDGV